MNLICNFCKKTFARKDGLSRHLKDERCNIFPTLSPYDIHQHNLSLQKEIDKLKILQEQLQKNTQENIQKSKQKHIKEHLQEQKYIQEPIQEPIQELVQEFVEEPIQQALIQEHIQSFIQERVEEIIQKSTQEPVQEIIQEIIQEPVQEIIQEPVQEIIQEIVQEPVQETVQKISEETSQKNQLVFEGIFRGRESEIRITSDKMISVFDFIRVVGGQANPKQTWKNIQKNHKEEVVQFLDYLQFPGCGQKLTPVINVQGMVKLLFWLPGEMAKQFRSKSAEVMIRYLGGDTSLIEEIKMIDQHHTENPDNIAKVFREEVNNANNANLLNYDQINHSRQLLDHFGSKTDIFYMLLFSLAQSWYLKFGVVNIRCFYERYNEHVIEFGPDICVVDAFQSPDVKKIESEHKNSVFFKQHSTGLPKKSGTGNHKEIYQLSETLTYNKIRQEILKTANNRITDPPPTYTPMVYDGQGIGLDNASELTRQIEIKEITKQIEAKEFTERERELTEREREKTKQKQIELEIKKLEFEMMKLSKS